VTPPSHQFVAGLDGCRFGWVMVTTTLAPSSAASEVRVLTDLAEVVAALGSGRLVAATIDIPIGLAADGPRAVDGLARQRLGPRRSSVFSAPVRPVLSAATFEEACRISRSVWGKGISRQLFGILPKIRELDQLQSPHLQEGLVEMHPELSFTELAGAPMQFHKSKPEGRSERLHALRPEFPDVESASAPRLRGTHPDDVLDAFVGAWSARRYATGMHAQLGGEHDQTGLRMEMIA
jgi:predicted RNase H-like nuclease